MHLKILLKILKLWLQYILYFLSPESNTFDTEIVGKILLLLKALQCTLSIILHFNSINFPSSHNKYPIEIYTISKYYWKISLLKKWISEASRDRASSLHLKRGSRRLQICRHLCARTINMVDINWKWLSVMADMNINISIL